jgi:hypothetical protein
MKCLEISCANCDIGRRKQESENLETGNQPIRKKIYIYITKCSTIKENTGS